MRESIFQEILMTKRTYIYGLYDPRELVDGEIENIRYIGKADNPLFRLRSHISAAKNDGKEIPIHRWIRKLIKNGVRPEMLVLLRPLTDYHEGTEQHVIDVFRNDGHDLLNAAEGGIGGLNLGIVKMMSDPLRRAAHRDKIKKSRSTLAAKKATSEHSKHTWADSETRAKHYASSRKAWADPERKKRWIAGLTKAQSSPAQRVINAVA